MLPKVILHNAVSLDGRIDGFPIDLFQYYELIATWKEDATLAGSDTFLKAASEAPPEDESAFLPPKIDPGDSRALLAIPDSRGRIRTWHYLRSLPYWRDVVALCSKSTPQEYLALPQREAHRLYHRGPGSRGSARGFGGAELALWREGRARGRGRHPKRPAPAPGPGKRSEPSHLSQPGRRRKAEQHLSRSRPAGHCCYLLLLIR